MIAAASAHYARKAGALTPALRKRALSLIESHGDPRSPVTWLSPHWLASLASDEAGRARRARMEPGASGPYLAWLRSIAVPET